MRPQKDINELFKLIIQDEKLNVMQKRILLNEVRKLRPPEEDRWVYRTIVWVLGAVAIGTVIYPFVNTTATEIPAGLLSIGSAAMGALAGYLTPNFKSKDERRQAPDHAELAPFNPPTAETQPEPSPAVNRYFELIQT